MKTRKQNELLESYLSQLGGEIRPLYREIAEYLSEAGYVPKKQKSSVSFKHDLHNKQIAKMGVNTSKKRGASPFFALRFSACRGYSKRFDDIVGAYIAKYPARAALCVNAGCDYCGGPADTHVYTYLSPDGKLNKHCGAYAVEIEIGIDVSGSDTDEIKKLISEEHEYLMRYEVSDR